MNDVIPVWNLAFLQSHRKRFSMLVCLLTSKFFWIPVSGHWDDTLLNRHAAIHSRYLSIDPANK
ncbi:MAG: hypothetical protein ACEY3F_04035 [Wolbachia sp.]